MFNAIISSMFQEISNHLDKDTEGYDVVLDAIDTMQRVAWHINDMKRKHEHDIRLQVHRSLIDITYFFVLSQREQFLQCYN